MPSVETLKARREAILAECRAAEKDRSSGWHPANHGAEDRELKGELALSERIVALQDDTEIYVCGPDVKRVVDACANWLPEAEAKSAAAPGAHRAVEHAIKCVGRLLDKAGGSDLTNALLGFGTQEWNGLLLALNESNLQVVSAGV